MNHQSYNKFGWACSWMIAIQFLFASVTCGQDSPGVNVQSECQEFLGQTAVPRTDCHPEADAGEQACLSRGCCWHESQGEDQSDLRAPYVAQPSCFFPPKFSCFELEFLDEKTESLKFSLRRRENCPKSGFPLDARLLDVQVDFYELDSLINIRITEPDRDRFEPKLPELNLPKRKRQTKIAGGRNRILGENIEITVDELKLKIVHVLTGTILYELDLGKLIYSQQFVQLQTYLASPYVYGLGLHMEESLFKTSGSLYGKKYTLFNYGHPPQADGMSAYSSYPFYINLVQLQAKDSLMEPNNGSSIGDFFESRRKMMAIGSLMLNSGPMDVLVQSNNWLGRSGLTWRLVSGLVNLFVFLGPQPNDVVGQYQRLVGKPALPPAWVLGYHQSRYNYQQLMSIKHAWAKTRASKIPMESFWTDIEYLENFSSYTLKEKELNDLVRVFQDQFEMHYAAIVDPTINLRADLETNKALKFAKLMNLFATIPQSGNSNNSADYDSGESEIAIVRSWIDEAGLLDFTHENIVEYLKIILKDYKERLNFDGLWLDMNEPEVFEQIGCEENFPYKPANGRKLSDRTLCMGAMFQAGKHVDLHNLYALYQTKAHYEALSHLEPSRRPFLISRSQFVGQGRFGGSWLGDLSANFEHLRWSILATIESNWFGQPLIGADICGFFGDSSDELCARWFSLGAFYPLARNHNDAGSRDQDPGSMGEIVQLAARVSLMKRYSLLPYWYSLFYENFLTGRPVIRSILFEMFDQFQTKFQLDELPQIDDQFIIGSSLLIAPIVYPDSELRRVYLSKGIWYDLSIGLPGTNMQQINYDTLVNDWPIYTLDSAQPTDTKAKLRLGRLKKAVNCILDQGCWLDRQYTPLAAINIYLRGGSVLPTFRFLNHEHSISRIWRDAEFFLEIGLNENKEAYGFLYWDNGESQPTNNSHHKASFWVSNNCLKISLVEETQNAPKLRFNGFLVYGMDFYDVTATKQSLVQNSKMIIRHQQRTGTLTCTFVDPNDEAKIKPITLERFNTLIIKW